MLQSLLQKDLVNSDKLIAYNGMAWATALRKAFFPPIESVRLLQLTILGRNFSLQASVNMLINLFNTSIQLVLMYACMIVFVRINKPFLFMLAFKIELTLVVSEVVLVTYTSGNYSHRLYVS